MLVVAVVAEPPEAGAGDTVSTTVHLGFPSETPVDFLFWTCLPLGEDACLEQGAEERYVLVEDASETLTVERSVPWEVAGVLAAIGEEIPLLMWGLACEEGLCPLIEQAKEGTVDEADLVNPIDGLKSLPFDGVSLAYKESANVSALRVLPSVARHASALMVTMSCVLQCRM